MLRSAAPVTLGEGGGIETGESPGDLPGVVAAAAKLGT